MHGDRPSGRPETHLTASSASNPGCVIDTRGIPGAGSAACGSLHARSSWARRVATSDLSVMRRSNYCVPASVRENTRRMRLCDSEGVSARSYELAFESRWRVGARSPIEWSGLWCTYLGAANSSGRDIGDERPLQLSPSCLPAVYADGPRTGSRESVLTK